MKIKKAVKSPLAFGLSALFVFGFFFAISFSTSIQTTKACPVEPPVPMRPLFIKSSKVVVATVSGSTIDSVDSEDESGKSVTLKITLDVSETLKGDVEPFIYISQWKYIPKINEGEAESATDEKFEVGKKFLLFLSNREEQEDKESKDKNKRYYLTDFRFGAKELSDADLSVYLSRLRELSTILKNKQPNKKAIVDWLVRCAEDSATRWDGAYDLSRNFNMMRYEEERKAQEEKEKKAAEMVKTSAKTDEKNKTDEVEEEVVEIVFDGDEFRNEFDSELAKLLTKTHKDRLSNALFQTDKLGAGDEELIDLVKYWEGKRVVSFMLPRLRELSKEDAATVSMYMEKIVDILKDEELGKVAEAYAEIAWSDENEIVDTDKRENIAEKVLEGEDVENTEAAETVKSETTETNVEEKTETRKAGLTVAQARTDLLEKFIAQSENLMADK